MEDYYLTHLHFLVMTYSISRKTKGFEDDVVFTMVTIDVREL
jgi:hypothetical protein